MVDFTFTMKTFMHACLACSCIAGSTFADPIQEQIDAMQQRIDTVETETDEMRTTLDIIRTDAEENWLSEERTVQIRSIVHDVLSDADSRSNLVGDGLLGGWDEGFFIASSDGRFKLKVGGLLQERYVTNHRDAADRWRTGFENTRTRLNISGHIFDKDTTFLVQPGFGWIDPYAFGSAFVNVPVTNIQPRLWDAWVKFKLSEEWSLKVGLFTLPFSRESLVSDQYQLAVDRSLLDYRIGLGRSQVIQFTWVRDEVRAFMAFTDGSMTLGSNDVVVNSNSTSAAGALAEANQIPPWSALMSGTKWSATARVEFLLEGDWNQFNTFTSPTGSNNASMFGVAFHVQQGELEEDPPFTSETDLGVTADLTMNFNGGTFFASGTFHNQKNVENLLLGDTPNVDWFGYVFQGSIYTNAMTEVFMRMEGGGPKQELYGDDIQILTSGVNWYLDGQNLKITTDFGWSFAKISRQMRNQMVGWRGSEGLEGEWLFRTQLQLLF